MRLDNRAKERFEPFNLLHDARQKSWTCKSSSPLGFQPTKTASIEGSRSMSREAVWFDYNFKWTVKLISFALIICFRSFSLRWSVQVLTGPALTNRIEHVYKSRGKYQNGETIKRGSIEVSKSIENKIIKKNFNFNFRPMNFTPVIILLKSIQRWVSCWWIQTHEVTFTDTDGQATLCLVKNTRRNQLDAAFISNSLKKSYCLHSK